MSTFSRVGTQAPHRLAIVLPSGRDAEQESMMDRTDNDRRGDPFASLSASRKGIRNDTPSWGKQGHQAWSGRLADRVTSSAHPINQPCGL